MTQQMQLPRCIIRGKGAIGHDPEGGDWDEVEHHPDGCWKSTKIASTVLGATWIILGKVCLLFPLSLANLFGAS